MLLQKYLYQLCKKESLRSQHDSTSFSFFASFLMLPVPLQQRQQPAPYPTLVLYLPSSIILGTKWYKDTHTPSHFRHSLSHFYSASSCQQFICIILWHRCFLSLSTKRKVLMFVWQNMNDSQSWRSEHSYLIEIHK